MHSAARSGVGGSAAARGALPSVIGPLMSSGLLLMSARAASGTPQLTTRVAVLRRGTRGVRPCLVPKSAMRRRRRDTERACARARLPCWRARACGVWRAAPAALPAHIVATRATLQADKQLSEHRGALGHRWANLDRRPTLGMPLSRPRVGGAGVGQWESPWDQDQIHLGPGERQLGMPGRGRGKESEGERERMRACAPGPWAVVHGHTCRDQGRVRYHVGARSASGILPRTLLEGSACGPRAPGGNMPRAHLCSGGFYFWACRGSGSKGQDGPFVHGGVHKRVRRRIRGHGAAKGTPGHRVQGCAGPSCSGRAHVHARCATLFQVGHVGAKRASLVLGARPQTEHLGGKCVGGTPGV